MPLTQVPVPLASLQLQPFDVPPPAALAAGLRRLLEQSAGAAAESSFGGGGSSSRSSAGAVGSGIDGLQLSPGLQLRSLAEHANRFEVELGVDAQLGGSPSSSGLQLRFPGAPPGDGASQQIEVWQRLVIGGGLKQVLLPRRCQCTAVVAAAGGLSMHSGHPASLG